MILTLDRIGQLFVILISTVFVVIRCVVKRYFLAQWAAEDWLCVISWITFIGMVASITREVFLGGGKDGWNVMRTDVSRILHWSDVVSIEYNVVMLFLKTTILLTYKNIFMTSRKAADRWLITGIVIINAVFYICSFLLKIFRCKPRSKAWDPMVAGECINYGTILLASSIWNTVSDLVVLILPVLFVRRLKLRKKVKWQVIGFFTFGAIAFPIFSIVGIVVRFIFAFSFNATFWQPRIAIWSEAEIAAGFICACLPSVSFIIKRLRRRRLKYLEIVHRRARAESTVTQGRPGDAVDESAYGKQPGFFTSPDTIHLETVLEDIEHRAANHHPEGWFGRKASHGTPSRQETERAGDTNDNVNNVNSPRAFLSRSHSFPKRKTPDARKMRSPSPSLANSNGRHDGDNMCIVKTTEVSVSYAKWERGEDVVHEGKTQRNDKAGRTSRAETGAEMEPESNEDAISRTSHSGSTRTLGDESRGGNRGDYKDADSTRSN